MWILSYFEKYKKKIRETKNGKNSEKVWELTFLVLNDLVSTNITVKKVLNSFKIAQKFGEEIGTYDIRDFGLLESSIDGPKLPYYDVDLKRITEIYYRLSCNHCFTNGNKRTAVFIFLSSIFLAINYTVYLMLLYSFETKKTFWDNIVWQNDMKSTFIYFEEQFEKMSLNYVKKHFDQLYDFTYQIADSTNGMNVENKKQFITLTITKIIKELLLFSYEDLINNYLPETSNIVSNDVNFETIWININK